MSAEAVRSIVGFTPQSFLEEVSSAVDKRLGHGVDKLRQELIKVRMDGKIHQMRASQPMLFHSVYLTGSVLIVHIFVCLFVCSFIDRLLAIEA